MENKIAELKSLIAKLTLEVSKMKLEHAEDRVFFKALNSTVDHLHGQVQNLDKQIEAGHKKAEAQTKEAVTTKEAKEMSLTQIGELFKKDPAKAAEVMRQQGMNPSAGLGGMNPWSLMTARSRSCWNRLTLRRPQS